MIRHIQVFLFTLDIADNTHHPCNITPAIPIFHSTLLSTNFHSSSLAALASSPTASSRADNVVRLSRLQQQKAAHWRYLRNRQIWSAPRSIGESEDNRAAMGFSFRFGYKDWFDFSFRFGPRKLSQKSTAKDVLFQSKYHVKCNGPRSRQVEIKNDTVSRVRCSSCNIRLQARSLMTQHVNIYSGNLNTWPSISLKVRASSFQPYVPSRTMFLLGQFVGQQASINDLLTKVKMEAMLPMRSQDLSPLFKNLPTEIRHMIWALILVAPEAIHSPNRLLSSKTPLLLNDYHPIANLDAVILRTCRAIYNEALPILYGRNTFYFTSSHALFEFAGDDLPKALPTGDSFFLTGSVFNFQVTQAGRLALVRQLVLKLTSMDTSRNTWSIPSLPPPRPPRPPHRSTLLYDWGRLLCMDGRLPGMYDDAAFPALEALTLDFSDWALAQDEGLMVSRLSIHNVLQACRCHFNFSGNEGYPTFSAIFSECLLALRASLYCPSH